MRAFFICFGFLILLAKGLGLLAAEADLLAVLYGLLTPHPRIFADKGSLLAKRDLLEPLMLLTFRSN